MPFAGMDDTAQQSLIDKLDQRLAKRKEQQAREEEKAKEREKLENARRNKEALHAKLLEVAGSGRRVAALDDLNLDDEEIKMFTRALSQKAEELAATAAEMAMPCTRSSSTHACDAWRRCAPVSMMAVAWRWWRQKWRS